MKKKTTVFLAVLMICTFMSCGLPTPSISTQPLCTETPTVEMLEPVQELTERYTVPTYTGSPLIEIDPERKVYISLSNQDCDFYPNTFFAGVNVTILSTQHYNTNEIHVSIPMQTDYEQVTIDLSEECHQLSVNGSSSGLNNYQYLYLQKTDWHELGQLALDAMWASEQQSYYFADSEKFWEYEEIADHYRNQMTLYQEAYEAMSQADIPTMYAYSVDILFTGLHDPHSELYDETVKTVNFIIGEEHYSIDIGEWRFHTTLPPELDQAHPGVKQSQVAILAITDSPYNGGFVRLQDALSFSSQKEITVTGIRSIGANINILGGRVRISSSNANSNVDYYWDLQQPIFIDANSNVSIELYLKDDRFSNYEVNCTMYLLMDYEVDGKGAVMTLPCKLERFNNIWDTYFLTFAGYDIGQYYTCFYIPQYETWIRMLPDDWR